MKKMTTAKILALSLIASLLLPVTACKKKTGTGETGRKTVVSESDPYFTISEIDLPIPIDKDKEVEGVFIGESSFVGNSVVITYDIRYLTSQEEQDEMQKKLMNGQEEEYLKWYEENYKHGKKMFDLDGNVIMDLAEYDNAENRVIKIIENSGGERFAVTNKIQEGETILQKVNDDGSLVKTMELPVEVNEESDVLSLRNGNLMISDFGELYLVSSDGSLIGSAANDEFVGQILLQDEKYYGVGNHYDPEDWDQNYSYIQEITTQTGEFVGEKHRISDTSGITRGQDGSYSSDVNGITKLNLFDSSKNQEVFNWNFSDYNHAGVGKAYIKSENEVYFLSVQETYESGSKGENRTIPQLKLLRAVRAEKNPHAGKKIVRVGAFDTEETASEIGETVIRYNLDENSLCRIEMIYYSLSDADEGSGRENPEKALSDKVSLELLSGNGPDILMGFSWISRLNNDEVLVDLNPLIDAADGTGLDRSLYFDNLFRASEVGGELYQLPVTFTVSGFVGNKDVLGEKDSYSYQEFLDTAKALPDDVTVLPEMPYKDMLSYLDYTEFVDYGNKQVHFDDPAFERLLEIIKTYGSKKTHEQLASEYEEIDESRPDASAMFREGMLAFVQAGFTNLSTYARVKSDLGDKTVFCGTPNSDHGSMCAKIRLSMGISSFSENQKEAWNFLRFVISEEQQTCMVVAGKVDDRSMPVSRKAMTELNQKIRETSQEIVRASASDPQNPRDEAPVEITEEMTAELERIVESIHVVNASDPDVFSIIWEEAQGYFADQRSVDEVCRNIQNRTKTIVSER
ncbi:MAG: extracellular solute-binding protein [Clostridiales bacterium]|nr:extracellular solute-binding protein [Clostridiales bacterium]